MPTRTQIAAQVRATERDLHDRVTSAAAQIIGHEEAQRIAQELYEERCADMDDGYPKLTDYEQHLIERHERRSRARHEQPR